MAANLSNHGIGIPEEAMTILKSMASQWKDTIDPSNVQVIPLKGAMTNQVYQIKWPTNTERSRKVLVRIYGQGVDVFFDRNSEMKTFEFVSQKGQGPRLLGRFPNGRIEEFIRARIPNPHSLPSFFFYTIKSVLNIMTKRFMRGVQSTVQNKICGSCCNFLFPIEKITDCKVPMIIEQECRITLSASDLRDPDISALIAAKTREFHDLDMPGPKTVLLWDRLRNWLILAKSMCSTEEFVSLSLDTMQEEISTLEKSLMSGHQRIGFCHNDLQYGNIMIDDETGLITIIVDQSQSEVGSQLLCLATSANTVQDYEYASYNPVAFDIANHFCEMAADYHTETPHILNYNKYPSVEERKRFVCIYLGCSDDGASDLVMDQLVQEVENYTLASHLFWGLWGIISEHVNKIDFDYLEYARQRFKQYRLKKPRLLSQLKGT